MERLCGAQYVRFLFPRPPVPFDGSRPFAESIIHPMRHDSALVLRLLIQGQSPFRPWHPAQLLVSAMVTGSAVLLTHCTLLNSGGKCTPYLLLFQQCQKPRFSGPFYDFGLYTRPSACDLKPRVFVRPGLSTLCRFRLNFRCM